MQRRMELLRRMERQYFRRHVAAMGFQALEGHVLHLLDIEGELRQEDLAFKFGTDKGGIARAAAHLEKLGFIQRQVSDRCRREKLLTLTPEGRSVAIRIQQVLDDWDKIGYQGFSLEEQAQYEAFLLRITKNVEEFKRGEEEHNG